MIKTKLLGSVKALQEKDLAQFGVSKASMISEAKTLIPEKIANSDFDLLPVVFDLAVVNQFNDNGDGVTSVSAAKMVKKFIDKPFNLEHEKDEIVGHIVNASFSEEKNDFFENDITDFLDKESPFYITAAAVIYRHVFPRVAEVIMEASNPESPYYESLSASWEVAFSSFDIVVGEDFHKSKKYTSDSSEFDRLKNSHKMFGGKGYTSEGEAVNRLLGGELVPLGAAITENPAAKVKGIFTLLENNSSQNKKEDVTTNEGNTHTDMTDEQFDKITQLLEGLAKDKKLDETKASNGFAEIQQVIKEAGEGWKAESEKDKEALKEAQAELENVQNSLNESKEELTALKNDLAAKEAADLLNFRVNAVTEKYELSEAEEKIVVEEIRSLGSEESEFSTYLNKVEIVFAHKNKEKLALEKEESKESTASKKEVEEVTENNETEEEELETSESTKVGVTNNNGDDTTEETLFDRLAKNGLSTNLDK